MPELTLESLAKRLDALEQKIATLQPSVIPATKDWRSVVGISQESEFSRRMQAEIAALKEADRQAAEAESSDYVC